MLLHGTVRDYDPSTGKKICKSSPDFFKNFLIVALSMSRNRNEIEYKNYCKMPEKIKNYFPKMVYENRDIIAETVKDIGGEISSTLSLYQGNLSEKFWEELEKYIGYMIEYNYYLYDLSDKNILVQTQTDNILTPKIIDCKRLGYKNHPLQLNLILKSERVKKIYRQLDRLKEKYQK